MQDYQSSPEEKLVAPLQSTGGAWRKQAQVAGAVAGILLIAAVVAHGTSNRTDASIEEAEYFAEVVAQPNWQISTKEADLHSKITADCSEACCSKTAGYKYAKDTVCKEEEWRGRD